MEILNAAWDLGINTIDTANEYSDGESERIIGTFMQQVRLSLRSLFHPLKLQVIRIEPDSSF